MNLWRKKPNKDKEMERVIIKNLMLWLDHPTQIPIEILAVQIREDIQGL